jgi:hypothetical protein
MRRHGGYTVGVVTPRRKLRWYQFSLRGLLVFMVLTCIGMSAVAAYFRQATVDGKVLFPACACGYKHAQISDGKLTLLEPNHEQPAGSVLATVEIKAGKCTVRRIKADGTIGDAECYDIDHLGARCYSPPSGEFHIILVDNWKLYVFRVVLWIENLFH